MSAQSEKLELLSAPPSSVGLFLKIQGSENPYSTQKPGSKSPKVGRGPRGVRGIGGHEVQGHLLVGS